MSRAQEIDNALGRICKMGLTITERSAILDILVTRITHRERAARLGIKRESSRKQIQRARQRARKQDVDIPHPRRGCVKRTLAQLRR